MLRERRRHHLRQVAARKRPGRSPQAGWILGRVRRRRRQHDRTRCVFRFGGRREPGARQHDGRVKPKDIHVAEVHECFTIAELMPTRTSVLQSRAKASNSSGTRKRTRRKHSGEHRRRSAFQGTSPRRHGRFEVRTIVLQLRGEACNIQVKNPPRLDHISAATHQCPMS